MKIHYLQHVPFEDLANLELWAKERDHTISVTRLYEDQAFPDMEDFDWLVIMGGPMNIFEYDHYPWLEKEKRFIEKIIARKDKVLLGICLGAQLIAHVLGGRVYKNDCKEIGWFPVTLTEEGAKSALLGVLPKQFMAFHWHGDTFEVPKNSVRTVKSEGCENQAFEYDGRVLGLQFHLESSSESIQRLIEHCGEDIVEGNYIQTAEEMMLQKENVGRIYGVMTRLLDRIALKSPLLP